MNNNPARLGKGEQKTPTDKFMDKIFEVILIYANILIPLGITGALILFVIILYIICGVSAVESGAMRNFIATGV